MVHPSLNFLCILLNTTQCKKIFAFAHYYDLSLPQHHLCFTTALKMLGIRHPLQEYLCMENEKCILKLHLERLNKLWNLSPADTSVFILFGKILFTDNPWFQETMGLNQVLKSGARLLETLQPWNMSSRAVWSGNNWNLYQGDGDVIWDSLDITWKAKKNKRQHIHKHRRRD